MQVVEGLVEVKDEQWMSHVDEGKAYILHPAKVHGQIEVIVLALEPKINEMQQIHLPQLNRHVSDHEGGETQHLLVTIYLSMQYAHQVNLVILRSLVPTLVLAVLFNVAFEGRSVPGLDVALEEGEVHLLADVGRGHVALKVILVWLGGVEINGRHEAVEMIKWLGGKS